MRANSLCRITTNPKRRILDDLEQAIQESREKKFRVILMMDANENWTKKEGKELKAFMSKVQLCDPLYERHYNDEVTRTYASPFCSDVTSLLNVLAKWVTEELLRLQKRQPSYFKDLFAL